MDVYTSSPPVTVESSRLSPVTPSTCSTTTRKRSLSFATVTPVKMPRVALAQTPVLPTPTLDSQIHGRDLVSSSLPQTHPDSTGKLNLVSSVLFSDSSDPTCVPSTPDFALSVADSYNYDKREDDVVAVARSYLYVICQLFLASHVGSEGFDINVGYESGRCDQRLC